MPSKAVNDDLMVNDEHSVIFDSRLDDMRGSIDDFVMTGSLKTTSECNSPQTKKNFWEIEQTKKDNSTIKQKRHNFPLYGGIVVLADS
jgi:hypothetical protein